MSQTPKPLNPSCERRDPSPYIRMHGERWIASGTEAQAQQALMEIRSRLHIRTDQERIATLEVLRQSMQEAPEEIKPRHVVTYPVVSKGKGNGESDDEGRDPEMPDLIPPA